MPHRFIVRIAVVIGLVVCSTSHAALRVAQIFQDNMVLQRDLQVPVWGWADRGASVTIYFAGQTQTASADDKGYWLAELAPLQANAQGQSLTIVAGSDRIERRNVVVGEVWVLSGQSNMARPLRNDSIDYPFFKDYANDAEYPLVRFTNFGVGASSTPLDDVESVLRKASPWKVLGKSSAMEVMSIGFFFAKRITKDLDVPVGLVQVAVSGTPQTAWMARQTIESFPGEDGAANYYEKAIKDAELKMSRSKGAFKTFAEYEAKLPAWRSDAGATERNWPGDAVITDFPAVLYNARVHPLAPFAFRGMLWHQGEAGPGGAYGPRMVAMIKQHRALFKNDFHFIFGTLTRKTTLPPPIAPQVTNFGTINQSMIEGDQLFGPEGRGTLVNFFDLGNTTTHWAMKEEAGRRMALAAMDRVYGKAQVFTGPQLARSTIKGGTITCTFRHVGGGLKYEPSIDGISGVVLVDKSGTRYWADVRVTSSETLVLSHPKVADAASAHYGMHTNPHETLFNDAGFPAFAFSTGLLTGKTEDPTPIVHLTGDVGKAELNVSHVRREGYVFNVVELRGARGAEVSLRAYVPSEWKGVEVRVGDQFVDVGDMTDEAGRKFITVRVVVNGPSVTVAEKGRSDALARVRRF